MKVYEWKEHEKAMQLAAVKDNTHPIYSYFTGGSKLQIWSPVEVETLYKMRYNDFSKYLIGKPVISKRVKDIIQPYVVNEVEFLPLLHKDLELYMINVTNILDCIDWKRSKVSRFEDGSFRRFDNLFFDFNEIPDNTYIFKFKELSSVRVYITEAFKDLIESNKLKGLDFSVVYDSEFTEEKELEQQRNYEAALAAIESNKGPEFSYEEARRRVEQDKAVSSRKWKMQLDAKGRFCLGELTMDLSYQWILPIYIPPILLGYPWHEVEKSVI